MGKDVSAASPTYVYNMLPNLCHYQIYQGPVNIHMSRCMYKATDNHNAVIR